MGSKVGSITRKRKGGGHLRTLRIDLARIGMWVWRQGCGGMRLRGKGGIPQLVTLHL
jgi:hypothetical protein